MSTKEQDLAIREAAQNASSRDYFGARSRDFDTERSRRVFESGFFRGYDAATAPLIATIARQDTVLRFIERWANHHGAKSLMTAQEALSCIQHHPDVEALTKSYADGKVPDTPNPWARIKELEAPDQPTDGNESPCTLRSPQI